MEDKNQNSIITDYMLPASILISALIISGSIFIKTSWNQNSADSVGRQPSLAQNVSKVTEADYIRGSIDAPIKIIEFSDLECPFCKAFHSTMKQVVEEYGDQVAWVYRQFPVKSSYSKSPEESEAAECVGGLGGNEAFWKFVDKVFEETPSNNGLNLAKLPDYAEYAGVDRKDFLECMQSDKYVKNVDEDKNDGVNSGVKGTPYSIIVTENGSYIPISGSLDFSVSDDSVPDMKGLIERIIENL